MSWKEFFRISMLKIIVGVLILAISLFLMNDFFKVVPPGRPYTVSAFAYFAVVIFILTLTYLIVSIVYSVIYRK